MPPALQNQLATGGRLIMPVGEDINLQRLIRVTRRSETQFDQEDLGEVQFVPLIGVEGWSISPPPASSSTEQAGLSR